MKSLMLLFLVTATLIGCKSDKESSPNADSQSVVEISDIKQYTENGFGYQALDPAFSAFVDTEAPIDILASGFQWSEGPVWVPNINSLLFSDPPNNIVYRWGPANVTAPPSIDALPKPVATVTEKGTILGVDTFLYPSGYLADPGMKGEAGANGLVLDKQNRLWMAQHGERQVAIWNGNWGESSAFARTSYKPVISAYQGKKFHSPNDLALASNGDLYFTDPTYGVDKTFGEEARELDITGVYRVKSGSGEAELLYSSLLRPNGVVLTTDEKHFIVASSEAERSLFMKCDASSDPMAEADRCKLFADVTALRSDQNQGNCDGMVMHPSGILLATGPGGVLCFSESGKHLGTIRTGRPTANVTLGGPDGKDIFITANQLLLRARLQ